MHHKYLHCISNIISYSNILKVFLLRGHPAEPLTQGYVFLCTFFITLKQRCRVASFKSTLITSFASLGMSFGSSPPKSAFVSPDYFNQRKAGSPSFINLAEINSHLLLLQNYIRKQIYHLAIAENKMGHEGLTTAVLSIHHLAPPLLELCSLSTWSLCNFNISVLKSIVFLFLLHPLIFVSCLLRQKTCQQGLHHSELLYNAK